MSDISIGRRQIYSRALEKAATSETLIRAHLDACEDRNRRTAEALREIRCEMRDGFRDVERSVARVHNRIDKLENRWFAVAGAVVVVLLGAAGWLFARLPAVAIG